MKYLLLFLGFFLSACSHASDAGSPALVSRPDCPSPLVVLPDNYVVELAAGSIVELNPGRQQFALFCTVDEAKAALASDLADGTVRGAGRWKIYSVNGTYNQLARPCGNGQVCLGTPTTLLEWIE